MGTPGNFLVPVMMYGWIPLIVVIFSLLPARRAIIVSWLFAFLFMPQAEINFAKFPEYSRMTATSLGALLAVCIVDPGQFGKFRPKFMDWLVLALCSTPMATSISNGLGAYDGFSAVAQATLLWGVPYLMGRLYFNNLAALRELAIGIFIGGLVYIPFCLYEVRMSPQVHRMTYGFFQHEFNQTHRYGGWRPVVYMTNGLVVGLWMAMSSLTGLWLWFNCGLKTLFRVPTAALVVPLVVTTVLVKSTGALMLLVIGAGMLIVIRFARTQVLNLALAAAIVVFIAGRVSGYIDGVWFVDTAQSIFGAQRADSLDFRFKNENIMSDKATEKFWLGWGRWGRHRVYDEYGKGTVTDSKWNIDFGERGVVGLTLSVAMNILPAILLSRRIPARYWAHPAVGPAVLAAIILLMWMVDALVNSLGCPIFVLLAGGLIGLEKTALQPVTNRRATVQARPRPRTVYT